METHTLPPVYEPRLSLDEAWEQSYADVRSHLVGTMKDYGVSQQILDYIAAQRLYQRVPFLLTLRVPDPRVRAELARAIGLHILAMKLFDDLVDADSGMMPLELAGCLPLLLRSSRALCSHERPAEVLELLDRDFDAISRGQYWTKRKPAQNVAEWRAHARFYGAAFLAFYGRVAIVAGGDLAQLAPSTAFAEAFGMLITIADDLRDYERCGERDGNIGHLLRTGAASGDDVIAVIEDVRAAGKAAAREPGAAYDAAPVVDFFAQDVLQRYLAPHLARVPAAPQRT